MDTTLEVAGWRHEDEARYIPSTAVSQGILVLSLSIVVSGLGCRPYISSSNVEGPSPAEQVTTAMTDGSGTPPDLEGCTRIEIHYSKFARPGAGLSGDLINSQEKQYLESLETLVVNDRKSIRAFARSVGKGTYVGEKRGRPKSPGTVLLCHFGDGHLVTLTLDGHHITTQDGRVFEYSPGIPDMTILEPPGIEPLKTRWICASNLNKVYNNGLSRWGQAVSYPDPNEWCDAVVSALRDQYSINSDGTGRRLRVYSDAAIARILACPNRSKAMEDGNGGPRPQGANLMDPTKQSWLSDYAMNPDCEIDSPRDTVLLFEARSGCNQHGGPELFTFDNHDPKGGLVLLNDGTVKFIRTEQELKQLRWK